MKTSRTLYYKAHTFQKTSLFIRIMRNEVRRHNRLARRLIRESNPEWLKLIDVMNPLDNMPTLSGNPAGE